jgi:hypothetical protein
MIDYALRRRFAFISLEPLFNEKFTDFLLGKGIEKSFSEKIVNRISKLNEVISNDKNLQKGFQIGHSYFSNFTEGEDVQKWYHRIINLEIAPLLEEYWFDNEAKAQTEIRKLL